TSISRRPDRAPNLRCTTVRASSCTAVSVWPFGPMSKPRSLPVTETSTVSSSSSSLPTSPSSSNESSSPWRKAFAVSASSANEGGTTCVSACSVVTAVCPFRPLERVSLCCSVLRGCLPPPGCPLPGCPPPPGRRRRRLRLDGFDPLLAGGWVPDCCLLPDCFGLPDCASAGAAGADAADLASMTLVPPPPLPPPLAAASAASCWRKMIDC